MERLALLPPTSPPPSRKLQWCTLCLQVLQVLLLGTIMGAIVAVLPRAWTLLERAETLVSHGEVLVRNADLFVDRGEGFVHSANAAVANVNGMVNHTESLICKFVHESWCKA